MLILTRSWAAAGVIAAGARMAATASRVIAVRLIMTSSYARSPAPCGAALIHACRKYGISPCRRARRDHGIHAPIQPIFRHRPDTILNKRKRARLRGPAFGTQTPLATIVVVIVRIRDAVVIPVAIRSALATALVAIGDAVAVTVPAARDVAPLLAAAGGGEPKTTLTCAAAGVTGAMATVAVEKTAAAARDVIAICFNMTCLH